MSGEKTARWKKNSGILLLGLVSLAGVSQTDTGRHFVCSAHSFLGYYRALEQANDRSGFFDRVALSLVLASGDARAERKPASM